MLVSSCRRTVLSRNILRNPPRVIDTDQRIKYGAIHAIVVMAESAFADLTKLLAGMLDETNDATPNVEDINRALMLAWSIVDQADLLRHLINSESHRIKIEEKMAFVSATTDVQKVRNWMRHIPQRIKNYRAGSFPVPPILGALSFTTVVRARVPLMVGNVVQDADCVEYHTVILVNTAIERATQLEGNPIPFHSFRFPIDHIVLQAFGILLPLEPLVTLMGKFADGLASSVQRWLDGKMLELAEQGADTSDLTKPAYDEGDVFRMIARRD